MLKVENISKRYGKTQVLKDVSFCLKTPSTLGIIGTNGAGKSTLLDILTTLTKPNSGTAQFNGINLLKLPTHALLKNGIARTFQTPRLFNSLTVLQNFLVTGTTPTQPLTNCKASELDYALRRYTELTRALKSHPTLLFLDEFSAGMVEDAARNFLTQIKTPHLTTVMVEHNFNLVREFCTYTLALDMGEVLDFGETQKVLSNKIVTKKLMGE
jgi:branched-chain amino acid transport system ATP-binding protein